MERKAPFISSPKGKITYIRWRKTGKSRKRTCPKNSFFRTIFEEKKLFPAEIFTKKREFRPGIEAHGPFLRTDTQAPSAGGTETEKRRGLPRKTPLSTLKNNALVLLTRSAVLLTHFQLLAVSFFWPARENGLSLWYTDGGKARQAEEKTYNFARIRFLFVTFAFYNKTRDGYESDYIQLAEQHRYPRRPPQTASGPAAGGMQGAQKGHHRRSVAQPRTLRRQPGHRGTYRSPALRLPYTLRPHRVGRGTPGLRAQDTDGTSRCLLDQPPLQGHQALPLARRERIRPISRHSRATSRPYS